MKKIIGLLLISLAVFFNIDNVKGEDINTDRGTFTGACILNNQSDTECGYNCKITDGAGHYVQFTYTANSDLKHDISSVTTDGDMDYFGGKSSSTTTAAYELEHYPGAAYFLKNEKFTCPSVTATDHVVHTYHKIPFMAGYVVYNYITIDAEEPAPEIPIAPPNISGNACGLLGSADSKTVKFIKKIYSFIKVIVPLLVVALSIVDFVKVVGTGKDDDMKKATNKLIKRIIIAIVIILVPLIIEFLINVSGIASNYSGVSDGLKALACILG